MYWCFLLVVVLHFSSVFSAFTVTRSSTGDSITNDDSMAVCGTSSSCSCPAGETFLNEAPNLCTDTLPECTLKVEGSLSNLYTAHGSPGYFYKLTVITGTSRPVCEANSVFSMPAFVRDYQNKMIWNSLWTPEFQQRIAAEIDGSKIKLHLRSHWSGMLMKIYIHCGDQLQCIAIKFPGKIEHPITIAKMSELIGPALPLPSILPEFPSSVFTPVLTSTMVALESSFVTTTEGAMFSATSSPAVVSTSSLTLQWSSTVIAAIKPSSTSSDISFEYALSRLPSTTPILSSPTKMSTSRLPSTTPILSSPTKMSASYQTSIFSVKRQSSYSNHRNGTSNILRTISRSTSLYRNTTDQSTVSINTAAPRSPSFGAATSEDRSYVWDILIVLLALFLIFWLGMFIWCCKRRNVGIFAVEDDTQRIIQREHKSVLSLSATGSMSSTPATLNSHMASPATEAHESHENPVFDWNSMYHSVSIEKATEPPKLEDITLTMYPSKASLDGNKDDLVVTQTSLRPLQVHSLEYEALESIEEATNEHFELDETDESIGVNGIIASLAERNADTYKRSLGITKSTIYDSSADSITDYIGQRNDGT